MFAKYTTNGDRFSKKKTGNGWDDLLSSSHPFACGVCPAIRNCRDSHSALVAGTTTRITIMNSLSDFGWRYNYLCTFIFSNKMQSHKDSHPPQTTHAFKVHVQFGLQLLATNNRNTSDLQVPLSGSFRVKVNKWSPSLCSSRILQSSQQSRHEHPFGYPHRRCAWCLVGRWGRASGPHVGPLAHGLDRERKNPFQAMLSAGVSTRTGLIKWWACGTKSVQNVPEMPVLPITWKLPLL